MLKKSESIIHDGINHKLQKLVNDSKYLKNALLLVDSNKLNIHWKFTAGVTGDNQLPINEDNPYHIASIGKTFTSTLISMLYERGKIKFDDPISKYLSSDILKDLFVYDGIDYSRHVEVRHLLNHSSGIADYYEDKPLKGKSMKEIVIEEPQRIWKPEDTIAFTKDNFKAYSTPTKKFHYSEAGYNLLGLIIENISNRPFHESLHTEIFDPLAMENSYMLFNSKPKKDSKYQMSDVFLGKHEVSKFNSFSVDWAGGGIVSTMDDLLIFQKALVNNTLVKKDTFELCKKDLRKFSFGMDYGYGILLLDIGKMTFVLPNSLNMWGNFSSFASYMFYNPEYDVYLIGTFNHSKYVIKQVFF